MNVRAIAVAVTFCSLCLPAFARHHMCWVDEVTDVGDSVRVGMRSGYERAARYALAPDRSHVPLARNPDGTFDLKEGYTVLLSTFPSDMCTGTSIKHGDKLGLELRATNCMPGHGCNEAKDFVEGG